MQLSLSFSLSLFLVCWAVGSIVSWFVICLLPSFLLVLAAAAYVTPFVFPGLLPSFLSLLLGRSAQHRLYIKPRVQDFDLFIQVS